MLNHMRMRKDLLEQVLFVFGSILTCALVLGATRLQAELQSQLANHPLLSQLSAPVWQEAHMPVAEPEPIAAQAAIESCLDPSVAESALRPSLQNCWQILPLAETALARMDLMGILETQHANPMDESSLRTSLPIDLPTMDQLAEERSKPEIERDLILQLCENDSAEPETAFTIAANRLLCEAVGTSEDFKNPVRPTFVAAARLPF